jgi:hypothetical protein
MLSIVPLLNGGGLFETGGRLGTETSRAISPRKISCAGTARRKFFCPLAASFEHLAREMFHTPQGCCWPETLDEASQRQVPRIRHRRAKSALASTNPAAFALLSRAPTGRRPWRVRSKHAGARGDLHPGSPLLVATEAKIVAEMIAISSSRHRRLLPAGRWASQRGTASERDAEILASI